MVLAPALLLLALAPAAPLRAQEAPKTPLSRTSAGLAASAVPGLAVSSVMAGDGPVLHDSLPVKLKFLKGWKSPFFVKSRNELFVGGLPGAKGWDVHLGGQDRFGLGVMSKSGFYALLGMGDDAEMDWGALRRGATMIFVGPEIGKAFKLGPDGVVYAGAASGYGWLGGTGPHAEGLTYGATVDGRVGKPGVKGTVRFGANATAYPGALRSNVSLDMDVNRRLTLGAGVRSLDVEGAPELDLTYPYARVTYGIGR